MKKVVIFVSLLLLLYGPVGAGELFINTDPIGAEVYFGAVFMGKTPVRLIEEERRPLRIVIEREGYGRVRETIDTLSDRSQSYFFNLIPESLDIVLSQTGKQVFINGVDTGTAPLIIKNMPNGIYRVENRNGDIHIRNAEFSRLKRSALLETLFSSGLLAASLAGAFDINRTEQQVNVPALIFGGLLGYNLIKLAKIESQERRDRLDMSAIEVSPYNRDEDREIFADGVELVGNERYEEAIARFNLLVNVYPSSAFVPLSYYEIGYCYFNANMYENAASYFRRYVYEYPAFEFYHYALYYLLETELIRDNTEQALRDYRNQKPFHVEEGGADILARYYDTLLDLFDRTGGSDQEILQDLLRELDYYLEENPESDSYADILLLKAALLYRYLSREEGREILLGMKETYSYSSDLTAEVDRVLDE
jgi:tetratricopeptide (TPR) repeat protein